MSGDDEPLFTDIYLSPCSQPPANRVSFEADVVMTDSGVGFLTLYDPRCADEDGTED